MPFKDIDNFVERLSERNEKLEYSGHPKISYQQLGTGRNSEGPAEAIEHYEVNAFLPGINVSASK